MAFVFDRIHTDANRKQTSQDHHRRFSRTPTERTREALKCFASVEWLDRFPKRFFYVFVLFRETHIVANKRLR